MKISIFDHTLYVAFRGAAYMVRPCNDWTGKFSFNEKPVPMFKRSTFEYKNSMWHFLAVPYFLFGKITLKRLDTNP